MILISACVAVKKDVVYPHNKVFQGSKEGRPFDLKRLVFHSDQGATDLIALLSISTAKEGGVSKWVSAVAIHNELLRRGRQVCLLPISSAIFLIELHHVSMICGHRD